MGLFGPPNIDKMKAKKDIKGLIKALSHNLAEVRASAATALGELRAIDAVEPLIAALNQAPDVVLRWKAIEALGKIGDARALEPLIATMKGSDSYQRLLACTALGGIRDARAVNALLDALRSPGLRGHAALALRDAEVPQDAVTQAWLAVASSDWTRARSLGSAAIEPLHAALRDREPADRREAALALGALGTQTVDIFLRLVQNPAPGTTDLALAGLGAGPASVMTTLQEYVVTDAKGFRQAAAMALFFLACDTPLATQAVREAAGTAIVQVGQPFVGLLESATKVTQQATEAIGLLGRIGGPQAITALVRLHGRRDATGEAAKAALAQAGISAIPSLVTALRDVDPDTRLLAVRVLTTLGAPAAESIMVALADVDVRVRQAAAVALGSIRDHRALGPLLGALHDTNWSVRQSAGDALGRLSWQPEGVHAAWYWIAKGDVRRCSALGPDALDALKAALKDAPPDTRRDVADALGQIKDARAMNCLVDILSEGGSEVVLAAVRALVNFGAPAVEPLVAVLASPDWRVREAASLSLRELYHSEQIDQSGRALILSHQHMLVKHVDEERYDGGVQTSEGCFADVAHRVVPHTDREVPLGLD